MSEKWGFGVLLHSILLSQTLSSGHAPSLHNRDHFEQRRHDNSPLIDFTSDSFDRDPNPPSEYQSSEERQLSSAAVDLPPWLQHTGGHTDTTHHKPIQHGCQRDGVHNLHTTNLSRPLLFHPDSYPQDDYRGLSNPPPHQTEPYNYRNSLQYPPPLMRGNFHRLPPPIRESQWSNHRGAFDNFHSPPPSHLPNRVPVVFPPLPTIEIETVPSEKLFDLPGRRDRPSHVSLFCTPVKFRAYVLTPLVHVDCHCAERTAWIWQESSGKDHESKFPHSSCPFLVLKVYCTCR